MNENETVRGEQSVPQPNESPVTDAAVSAPTPPAAANIAPQSQSAAEEATGQAQEPETAPPAENPDQTTAAPKKVYVNAPPKKKEKAENRVHWDVRFSMHSPSSAVLFCACSHGYSTF